MDSFLIEGGFPLSGTVVPAGNKNGALPILAASLLTTEQVVIANVPRISDVDAMLSLLEGIGVTVEWTGDNEVALCSEDVNAEAELDRDCAERIRASFLLAGPLLARFGEAVMPPPGGDVIGRRRLDPHLDALGALGAQVLPALHQAFGREKLEKSHIDPVAQRREDGDPHRRQRGDAEQEHAPRHRSRGTEQRPPRSSDLHGRTVGHGD